jgi:tetratricopeptide (TPR) repeat protein/DNA-binding winged helix-turn-helix (wHTH) protein
MKLLNKQVYRFAGVEVDPSQGCLRRNGVELPLRQKSIQVLLFLLEQRHRLVTKEELIERVWAGTAVSDDALVQLIKEIRQSLGDDPRQPQFIKTMPKAGYRFIASVDELSLELDGETRRQGDGDSEISPDLPVTASPRPRPRLLIVAVLATLIVGGALTTFLMTRSAGRSSVTDVTLPSSPGRKPLAVMHFDNQSGSPDLDWLREGLADMLIANFSRSKQLNVLSRQQLFILLERIGHRPADPIRLDDAIEIGRKSKAEVIVLGSFARLGDKIRINVSLYDTSNGQQTASETSVADRPEDILTQMDLLSFKLSNQLGVSINGAADPALNGVMTKNLEAYRNYSLALEKVQALHNQEALTLLQKAVALDPEFAMAHARIGYTYAVAWGLADKGKPYLEKAFKLSDRLTGKDKLDITAWYAIANLDYPGAAQVFRQLIAQYPTEIEAYWRLGRLLLGEEKYEEAIDVLKRGLVVDSEAKDVYNALGATYRDMGRHNEAIAMSERYVELAPDEANAHDSLALAYQAAGNYQQALEQYNRALSLNPDFDVAILHMANLFFQTGRYREAIRNYQRYIELASSDWDRAWGYGRMAWVYRRKGEIEQAAVAARKEWNYEKSSIGNSLIIALERGDRATVKRLEEQLYVQGPYTERGLRPALRSVYYFRGHLALKNGRPEEAVENFKEVIKHRPLIWDIDSFEDCLANAYLELGRIDEAVAEYERILRLNPNYPLVHFHLGQVYERRGLPDQAKTAYEKFLLVWKEADADLPEVITSRKRLAS